MAEAEDVHLAFEPLPVSIEADPDRMLQVITNLLSNAIKFSPAKSIVRVVIKNSPDGATVSVVDQGRGVPADKLESIFDRFQQVDASDSRQKGGTGLGLAICRTIMHQHGGRIWAEQNGSRGTIFRFFLPDRAFTRPQRRGSRSQLFMNSIWGAAWLRKILIIDDEEDIREVAALSLETVAGWDVLVAGSGAAGIAKARENAP